jgi:hypothetical protein
MVDFQTSPSSLVSISKRDAPASIVTSNVVPRGIFGNFADALADDFFFAMLAGRCRE